jgi:HAUS augmin-like complex subunit 6-like protein
MAAVQSNSLLARHRSTRTAAFNLKPPAAPTSASNSTQSSASTPQGLIPSNVSTFLTNLRLLNLDLLPDWPEISSLTFSTRDSGQGQKRRIQCVEWALYQLFALWDPEETRSVCVHFSPFLCSC